MLAQHQLLGTSTQFAQSLYKFVIEFMNRWTELSIDNFGSGKVGKNNGDAAGNLPNRPPIPLIGCAMQNRPTQKHLEPAGGTNLCAS
jgi:hypothetical protein